MPSRLNQYKVINSINHLRQGTILPQTVSGNYYLTTPLVPKVPTQVCLLSSSSSSSSLSQDINNKNKLSKQNKKNDKMPSLTHVDQSGHANMVDVSNKPVSSRTASAVGKVLLGETAFHLVQDNKLSKGDVLTVAQIAGIVAAKRTSDLIPLCHNIPISKVNTELELNPEDFSVRITSEVKTSGVTGVEMEALTAVSVAALTVYDMCKAVTHDIVIQEVKLVSKTGGQRGDFKRTN